MSLPTAPLIHLPNQKRGIFKITVLNEIMQLTAPASRRAEVQSQVTRPGN